MAKELQPCGTVAAARRHQRAGEPICDECQQAIRDEKNGRKDASREAAATEAREAMPDADSAVNRDDVLHEVLRTLRGQLAAAPPQSVASIAKQIRDTLDAMGADAAGQSQAPSVGLSDIAKAYQEKRKSIG